MAANDDEGATRQTMLPRSTSPDDQPTGHVADAGVIAELRAVLTNGERKTLPLYTLADQLVVGRGTACEWQLDDTSLSRKHAQIKWNGHELTIEDLGSANGTRVGGRPARLPTPVRPGEVIQLGTVMLTLELRGQDPDAQSTRLVQTPESQGFPALPGLATVVKPTQPRAPLPSPSSQLPLPPQPAAPPSSVAQVFRPARGMARPDEPTTPWDPRAALYHPPERAFDNEFTYKVKEAWKTNRRPFVLAGAALWIGLLLGVWYLHDSMVPEEETVQMPHVPAPRVTALTPPATDPIALPSVPDGGAASEERDAQIADAIAAYDQGRLDDALGLFQRLAPADETARFMVDLIQQKLHGAAR